MPNKRHMKTRSGRKLGPLCEARLNEIEEADRANLQEYAECRLVVLGASPRYGEDVTQRAFQLVLQGLEMGQDGRKPRMTDVVNKPAFLNYLRGVISSVAYGIIRKSGFRAEHKPWDDDRPGTAAPGNSPEQNAELNEFRYQFFQRLRKRAPERLLSTIDAWESVFTETDRIPAPSRREYVAEVRNLAKEVISEIEGIN